MSRIKELETKINQARKDYYNGQSTISDLQFDALVDELAALDPKNLAVIGIGAEPVSNWEKYTHKVEMGSLNKAQTDEEYKKWHDKYVEKDQCLLTLKLDGLSVSLIYENGVFVKGVTRGSGTAGEIITPNVARMIGVPLRLPQKIDITVRGEILLSKENHQKYFPEYSNPRNAASGISRRYDGEGSDKLTILSYQAFSDDTNFDTISEQFDFLKELGFEVPAYYVLDSLDKVISKKNEYQAKLREEYGYLLDGLVIHANDLSKHYHYGSHNARPYASIAFKFESVAKIGTISDIIIQVGNSGRLTPVAVFSPKIHLAGAEVERASLHNFSNIKELGVGIGAEVLASRRNDVIPFVEEVISLTGPIFEPPSQCPACGTPPISVGEYIQCPNTIGCPAQVVGRIKNWIKELNILEWGDSIIEKAVESKKVKDISDLYLLTVDDLAALDRMGKKSAQNCYNTLWANKEVSLDVFLGGLSIPMIGGSTIRAIMNAGCDTLEKFGQLSAQEFEKVPGVGGTKAKFLADGLKDNQQLILNLLTNGVVIKSKTQGVLSGKSICYTGTMVNKRAILEKMAADAGAEVKSSVGKGLTLLVINDINSSSSKAVSAQKLGTKLISEDEFLEMVK